MSTEFVRTKVEADDALDGLVVEFAFVLVGTEPTGPDWIAGEWEPGLNIARVLIGPGTPKVLTDGLYNAYVRITSSPEIPVIKFDQLRIQ